MDAGPSGSGTQTNNTHSKVTRSTAKVDAAIENIKSEVENDVTESQGPAQAGNDSNEQLRQELYYLIIKFLETGPCSEIATQLKALCETNQLLPPRKDWTGRNHVRSFNEFDRFHPHVTASHLVDVCSAMGPLLERAYPGSGSSSSAASTGIGAFSSLLGSAVQSLLRSPADHGSIYLTLSQSFPVHKQGFRMPINCVRSKRNVPNCVIQSAYDPRHRNQLECAVYRRLKLRKRIVGHGNSVYCVVFDRTSRFVITGADDSLIKVWCCRSLRLLATLRGHRNEICDLAVSHDNRLLASGACDKRVMIWRLDSCAPIAVLSVHTSAIISVAFSPSVRGSKRWLASTAKDGCVCFWAYDPISLAFENRPVKFIERSRPGCCMMCSCFSTGGGFFVGGCSDHAIRVYSFQPGVPEKIGELEGHKGSVDSVAYSHWDDRFASCSTDGTCRVWCYSRQVWRSLVLCPPGPTQQARGVSWTADDRCIVTTHSNHLVHCWDSRRGHLLAVFRDHRDDVFVVDCHPLNPRLFLTAGYDGKIAVRNLESSSSAFRHVNQTANTRQPVSLFEGKFSPDGDSLAVVDAVGHVLMFGLASDDSADAQALDEQFFHTDFSPPPALDANGWPLDETTQRQPHLMPPPYLVDALMQPYPADIQRRVPGRESLPLPELIPYCRTDDSGDMRVVDDSIAESIAVRDRVFGPPRAYLQTPVWQTRRLVPPLTGAQLAQSTARRQAAGDREVRQFCIECRLRPADSQAPLLARASRQQQQQQQQTSHHDSQLQSSLHGGSAGASQSSSGGHSSAVDQQLLSQRESQQQLPQQQSHQSLSQALPVESTVPAAVESATTNRLTARALYDTDVETGGSGEDVDRVYAQLEAAGDDSSDNRTTESEYSDWLEDEGAGRMAMPKRVQRRKVRRPAAVAAAAAAAAAAVSTSTTGRQNLQDDDGNNSNSSTRGSAGGLGDDDDDEEESETTATTSSTSDEDSDDSESDEAEAESPAAPVRRPPGRPRSKQPTSAAKASKKKKATSRSTGKNQQALLQPPTRSSSRRPAPARSSAASNAASTAAAASAASAASAELEASRQRELKLSEDYRPPEWLTSTLPRHSPYVPQIGDEIVYFRQGHQQYIDSVQATKAYKVDRELPWLRMPDMLPHVQMKVSGMKPLLTKSPRLVHMTLAFADGTRGKFQLRFHDMDNVLDFMVLRQTYDRALERNWQIGDRFRAIIDDYWWSGTIVGIAAYDEAFPQSHWLSVRAKWDNDGTEESLSLWDLHPLIVEEDGSEAATENRPVTASEFASLQYTPCQREWPNPAGRPEDCARLAAALDYLIDLPVFSEFAKPVDLELYPTYGFMIAYPIDLSTIRSRLRNMYYRRLLSVQYDVRFLANNAEYFNEDETAIVRRARLLTDLLLDFIQRTDCTDVGQLYREMLDGLDEDHRFGLHLSEFEDDGDEDEAVDEAPDAVNEDAEVESGGSDGDVSDGSGGDSASEDDDEEEEALAVAAVSKKRKRISSEPDAAIDQPEDADPEASSSLPAAAASGDQQPLWTRLCYRVLAKLSERDESLPFQHPVDLEAYPDYLDVVPDPIDLSTARQRLSNGCYASPLDFFRDLQRMFSNSRAYNTVPTSRIYQMTLSLQREFERLMNGALKRWRRLRSRGLDVSVVVAAGSSGNASRASRRRQQQQQQQRRVKRARRRKQQPTAEVVAAPVASAAANKRHQQQPRRTASAAPNRGRSAAAASSSSSAGLANGGGGLRKRVAQVNYCESDDDDNESDYGAANRYGDRDGDTDNNDSEDSATRHGQSTGQPTASCRHPRTRRRVQLQERRRQRLRRFVDDQQPSASAASTRPKRRRPTMVETSGDDEDDDDAIREHRIVAAAAGTNNNDDAEHGRSKRQRRKSPPSGRSLRSRRPDYRAMVEDSDGETVEDEEEEEAKEEAAEEATAGDQSYGGGGSSVDSGC